MLYPTLGSSTQHYELQPTVHCSTQLYVAPQRQNKDALRVPLPSAATQQ